MVVVLINRWCCCPQVGNVGKFFLGYHGTGCSTNKKGGLFCLYIQYRSSVQEVSLSHSYLQRASAGRFFSCLNRVKTFLRNLMTQERLSALALCINWKEIFMKLEPESTHMVYGLIGKEKRSTSDFAVQIIIWVFIFYIYCTCNTIPPHIVATPIFKPTIRHWFTDSLCAQNWQVRCVAIDGHTRDIAQHICSKLHLILTVVLILWPIRPWKK